MVIDQAISGAMSDQPSSSSRILHHAQGPTRSIDPSGAGMLEPEMIEFTHVPPL